MWRYFLTTFFAAALGCITATLIWAVLIGVSSPGGLQYVMAVAVISMFFALPGAAMLLGVRAILLDRGWPKWSSNLLVPIIGAVAGFASLGLISGWDLQWSATGAFFALTTGAMLLIVERMWAGTPQLNRVLAGLWTVAGASLLVLITLGMMPI